MTQGTVFFGTDFSPSSERAFGLALEEAKLRSAPLVVAHVIPTPVLLDYGIGEVAPLRAICQKKLDALKRRADAEGIETRVELLEGIPHVSLVQAAQDANAEIVVLGTRGRTGISRLVFGSVALRVACESPCPVVVVRAVA